MPQVIFGIALLIFGGPPISLDWKGTDYKEFIFTFDSSAEPCRQRNIVDGFKVKYRFRVQACRFRNSISSQCGDVIHEIHDVRFDPVTEQFKVTTDRLGDEYEPRSVSFSTKDEAFQDASKVDAVAFEALRAKSPQLSLAPGENSVVRTRVVTECQGGFREFVAWIPYLFSLGLIDRQNYDSGWYNFYLR